MAPKRSQYFRFKKPNTLPSSVTQVSREGLHELIGMPADKRLAALDPDFIYQVGPPTPAAMCNWPVSDVHLLHDADEINHLGPIQSRQATHRGRGVPLPN